MKIKITLRGNKEIYTNLTDEEYQNLKNSLLEKAKMIEIENRIINTSTIVEVEPTNEQETISKKFRLEEPLFSEKKIRVPGGWQTIEGRKRMEKLWQQMKTQGCFVGFNSYIDWEKIKYAQDKEGLEAINS